MPAFASSARRAESVPSRAKGHTAVARLEASPRATVVIPAYNEADALPRVLSELVPLAMREGYEVIIVDDGSTDMTAPDVGADGFVRVVRHDRNRGKGAAIRTGIAEARADLVIFMDGDLTYPIEAIPGMVQCLATRDIVFAIRTRGVGNVPRVNRLGNRALAALISRVAGRRLTDPLTGLYAARRPWLAQMALASEGFAIEAEINIKACQMGLALCEHPITYRPRVGKTKLRPFRDGWRIVRAIRRHAGKRAETSIRPLLANPCTLSIYQPRVADAVALHVVAEDPLQRTPWG